MHKLDAKDQALLSLLRADARASIVELAKRLDVSRATIQNRMRRLEKEGVILGYTISVGPSLQRSSVTALMSIRAQNADEARVVALLRGNPHVTAVHHTTGRWDLIAEIRTDTLSSFNQIIGSLRLIEGITDTETNLLLDSYE